MAWCCAALVGLVCTLAIPHAVLAAAVAVAVTAWLMIKFNGIHPPGGALVHLMVIGIVTQSDTLTALYKRVALAAA